MPEQQLHGPEILRPPIRRQATLLRLSLCPKGDIHTDRSGHWLGLGSVTMRPRRLRQLRLRVLLDRLPVTFRPTEHAMTAPHFCVGSAYGDTETSAPGA